MNSNDKDQEPCSSESSSKEENHQRLTEETQLIFLYYGVLYYIKYVQS